jgi:hypothetical protein
MASASKQRLARAWHGLTFVIALASIVTELVMVANGYDPLLATDVPPASTRVIRFLSYFTIESNLLVAATAAMLAAAPAGDGTLFRVLRLDALLGITVTLVTYAVVLAPQHDPHGLNAWTNAGLHYVVPAMAIVGWLLFGPRPRIDDRTLLLALIWPGSTWRTRWRTARRATGTRTRSSTQPTSDMQQRCATLSGSLC